MANESRKRLWPDEDEWLDFFREYLCGHPELAEHVARIWFALIEHHDQGPEGRPQRKVYSEPGPVITCQRRSRIHLPGCTDWRTGITYSRFQDW
jgi:hypothetical protein